MPSNILLGSIWVIIVFSYNYFLIMIKKFSVSLGFLLGIHLHQGQWLPDIGEFVDNMIAKAASV
jgi:hypothetical protein